MRREGANSGERGGEATEEAEGERGKGGKVNGARLRPRGESEEDEE